MYSILHEVYDELAERLRGQIGERSYYAGCIDYVSGDVNIEFRVTLILYRREEQFPEGVFNLITDVVPVWWECHTFLGAVELLNDFDFTEIKKRIID